MWKKLNLPKNIVLAIVCTFFSSLSSAATQENIRNAIQPYIDSEELAGAVSMTSVSGKVEVAYFGYANPKKKTPFTEKSMFWIASMTKGITGAAVMTLVDKGLISLDDPVEKYIPRMSDVRVEIRNADGSLSYRKPKTKMTIRMCLSHVAGYDFNIGKTGITSARFMPMDVFAKLLPYLPLARDPMTAHVYANADIDICAHIIEIVTKKRFDDYLKEVFFKPLKMENACFSMNDEQIANMVSFTSIKKGKKWGKGSYLVPPYKNGFYNGGGALFATAGDIMKFYQMLANDGKATDGTRILSHKAILELSTAQYPQFNRYTLGLRQFGDWFGHDGALQTEAVANWKENRVALLFVQLSGEWNHPFKIKWRKAVGYDANAPYKK
jgi:CubicO group peptidase (beta-lactamase class C family)